MGWPLLENGVWLSHAAGASMRARAALFLDRDGVVIADSGYVSVPRDVRLLPGAAEMIRHANQHDIPVVVVTNQSGIDRKLFDWDDFAAVEARIADLLKAQGAAIDGIAACPFHPDFTKDYGPDHAEWRKPGAAMILALAEGLNLDRARSWLAGDRPTDIAAAREGGLAGAIQVTDAGDDAAVATDDDFTAMTANSVDAAGDLLARALLAERPEG